MFNPKRLAIDLGTSTIQIYVEGQGIVIQEPAVIAVSTIDNKVLAVGREAADMLGKVPENIEARRPIRNGGIASYKATELMLKKFFDKSLAGIRLNRPEVIVSVPSGLTSVEERAVIQALSGAGAGKIYLLPAPIAAAIGAKLPIHTSSGNMIVNIGAGTAEIAVLSLNGIVTSASKRGAGEEINEAIIQYLKRNNNILIGEQMAEKIKCEIGTLMPLKDTLSMEIRGRHTQTGLPDSIIISSAEIMEAIKPVMLEIVYAIRQVIEQTPPELVSDIVDRGVVFSGGTAKLHKLDELMTKAIGVPAYIVEDPTQTVITGLITALENLDSLKRSLKSI